MSENARPSGSKTILFLRPHEWALLGSILVVVITTLIVDRNHAYWKMPLTCLIDSLRRIAPIGILSLGATVVIIAGGIDLSAASTAVFCATVGVSLMVVLSPAGAFGNGQAIPAWITAVGCLGAVVSGLMVGTLHTWLIVALRLPPFIVTLGSLVGLRSFARALCAWVSLRYRNSNSEEMQFNDPFFEFLDKSEYIWVMVLVLVALATLIWIVLTRTVLGRHLYALGGNEQAARLSGIRTENIKWFAYCFSAFTASIAGIFYVAKQHSLVPTTMAGGHELNAIAAAVVGGTSLQGGIGAIPGTLLGAVFLEAVVDAVARIVKTNANTYEGLIVGIVVVLAVTVSQLKQIIRSQRQLFGGALGVVAIPILALVAGMMALMMFGLAAGISVGVMSLLLFCGGKWMESRPKGES